MSGGGGSAKKTPVTEGEKIQTELARDQHQYYSSTYAPLENRFRDEVTHDYSSRLAGQNATASMREMTPTLANVAMSGSGADTGVLGDAVTGGRVAGLAQGARELGDGRLEAIGLGMGITADANRTLSEAGRIQTNAAIDRTREQLADAEAKSGLRNAVLGAAAAVGGSYAMQGYMNSQENPMVPYTGTPQQSPAIGVRGTPSLTDLVNRANRSGGRP